MKPYGDELFKGAAKYYSQYRLNYPGSLIRFLVEKLKLDGSAKMLDIGCGPGRMALRFTDWFEEVVGIDLESEMIDEASRLSKEFRANNIKWFNGDINAYREESDDKFKLVTMAKSFHWMNREATLETLYPMVLNGGGVVIIDDYLPDKVLSPWQKKVEEVRKRWYGEVRRAGNTTYSHPKARHQEIVAASRFELEVHRLPPFEKVWTIESIIGNLYSTSFGAKRFLGDDVNAFENELTEELLALDGTGLFSEEINLNVIIGYKDGGYYDELPRKD